MKKIFKKIKAKLASAKYYRKLLKKGLFDASLYYAINSDVREQRVNALKHFLKHGWKEGRNPSQYFDVNYYLQTNPDVKNYGCEPLFHYLNYGWKELRNPNPYFNVKYYLDNTPELNKTQEEPLTHYINKGWKTGNNPSELFDCSYYLQSNLDVKLANMEPLYHYLRFGRNEGRSGLDLFEPLNIKNTALNTNEYLPSLRQCVDILVVVFEPEDITAYYQEICCHTTTNYRLILVSKRPLEFSQLALNEIDRGPYCQGVLQSYNLHGINAALVDALALVVNNFVILDNYTHVPLAWLERLMWPIENDALVASTSPFTNRAGICSFPGWLQKNDLPFDLALNDVDEYFRFISFQNTRVELPCSNGICMGFNRSVTKLFDTFEIVANLKNHSFEVRKWISAIHYHNYKVLHVTNLYVYSSKTTPLIADIQYSNIRTFIRKNDLCDLRNSLLLKMSIMNRAAVLIFDLAIGGGTEKYTKEILLHKHQVCIRIVEVSDSKVLIKIYDKAQLVLTTHLKSLEAFILFLPNCKFQYVYFNHLLTFSSLSLCAYVAQNHALKVVFLMHDYYALCPSFNLINAAGNYCNAELDVNKCNACIKNNPPISHGFIDSRLPFSKDLGSWRRNFSELLMKCDQITCFSLTSKQIFTSVYPQFSAKIVIEPHELRKMLPALLNEIKFNRQSVITIGVLGRLNHAKGKRIINELFQKPLFAAGHFKLVVIGGTRNSRSAKYFVTGPYELEDLPNIVLEHDIGIFVNASIWPETYCYTADEIIAMNFPLVCFNIGAHAERTKSYSRGFIVNEIGSEQLYQKIIAVAKHYGFKIKDE